MTLVATIMIKNINININDDHDDNKDNDNMECTKLTYYHQFYTFGDNAD